MHFKASNDRTYEITFNLEIFNNRFYLFIVEGGPVEDIWNRYDDGHNPKHDLTIGIAPFFNPQAGMVDWDNNWYHPKFIEAFVPPDLKEYCERVVRNLVLL
jgi:hypothetical protein